MNRKNVSKYIKASILFVCVVVAVTYSVVKFDVLQLNRYHNFRRLQHYAPANWTHSHLRDTEGLFNFSKNGPYITTPFLGRLGNLMFEYASIYGVARHSHLTPVVGDNLELWKHFRKLSALKLGYTGKLTNVQVLTERQSCGYDTRVEQLQQKNVQLQYYLQSWKYFNHVKEEIKHEFIFKEAIYENVVIFLETVGNKFRFSLDNTSLVEKLITVRKSPNNVTGELKTITLVGIHVRRGDIVNDDKKKFGYTVPEKDYFDKATKHFRDKYTKVYFVVCSDNHEWVRKNLNYTDMVQSENFSAAEDLALLTLCDHVIISEGTFGWWAAYLAGGEAIYYKNWPKTNSQLDRLVNQDDYWPPTWNGIH